MKMASYPDYDREDVAIYPVSQLPDLLSDALDIVAITRKSDLHDGASDHPGAEMVAIVAKKGRADLKVLYAPIDIRQRYGKVYLAGAGAGGRDSLTLRADLLLRHAAVIMYDDLIDTEMLNGYDAEKVYVGKRKGHHHADQAAINRMLFMAATKKQIVVRLKGGDPFIFGRGGEEMSYLRDRHVDVEVVPGVSAVQSAAASAGIPLTLRAVSGGVTLLSAHNALAGASDQTLVYYMCASRLTQLRRTLVDEGIAPCVPVALIYKAGFFDEAVTLTTVDSMHLQKHASPLLAIIGQTASLYRERPKILYTGDEPCRCLIPGKIVPLSALNKSGKRVRDGNLSLFSAVAFTNPGDVASLLDLFGPLPSHLVLYAYGSVIAEQLRRQGYSATVMELDEEE
jgi:uroporphyrin-III C-methyltransferase